MSLFNTVNILDLADIIGEEQVQSILSDFSCEKNMEIEVFVRKNALDFSKKKMSVTQNTTRGVVEKTKGKTWSLPERS